MPRNNLTELDLEISFLTQRRNELAAQLAKDQVAAKYLRPTGARRNRQVVELMSAILGAFFDGGGGHQVLGAGGPRTALTVGRGEFYIYFSPAVRKDKDILFFDVNSANRRTMWKGYFGVDVGTLLGGRLHLEIWRRPKNDNWEAEFLKAFKRSEDAWISGPLNRTFLRQTG